MSNELNGIQKFWAFAKPIALVVLAVIGYFQERLFDKNVTEELFLAIIILAIVLRGKSIGAGFVAVLRLLKKKDQK